MTAATTASTTRLLAEPVQAEPGHRPRLVGRLVPQRRRTRSAGSSTSTRSPLAGYVYTELGPQGFLPQDPAQLRDELAQRDLTVCGGTVFAGLHKGADALDKAKEDVRPRGAAAARGRRGVPRAPARAVHRHAHRRGHRVARTSTPSSGRTWSPAPTSSARYLLEEYGVKLVFHPHADTHVDTQERIERFLADTDPQLVNLCLDTGHVSYCDGDNIEIIERFPERITYVHLKRSTRRCAQRVPARRSCRWPRPCRSASCASRRTASRTCPPLLEALGDARPGDLHRHRAGPVPGRAAHPAADPGPRPPATCVGCGLGPGPALAVLTVRPTSCRRTLT